MALNCIIIYTRHTGIPNRLLVIKRNSDRKVPINNLLCKNLGDGTLVIMQMAVICAIVSMDICGY